MKPAVKPAALDLFCGEGGCSRGYELAGFDVTGVDIADMPRYPYRFILADAMDVLEDTAFLRRFDLVSASPPCQGYSPTRRWWPDRVHPRLIGMVRERLVAAGVPFAIENVEGARDYMQSPVLLCGTAFGLRQYRHRLFECSQPVVQPEHPEHAWLSARQGRPPVGTEFGCYVGHFASTEVADDQMGIGWMSGAGISQAVPPAYCRYIGSEMRKHLPHLPQPRSWGSWGR